MRCFAVVLVVCVLLAVCKSQSATNTPPQTLQAVSAPSVPNTPQTTIAQTSKGDDGFISHLNNTERIALGTLLLGILAAVCKGGAWLWNRWRKKQDDKSVSIEVSGSNSGLIAGNIDNKDGQINISSDTKLPADLQICVSPTRNGRHQLAQIRVLNTGQRPILLDAWFVMWTDKSMSSSVCCERGVLPVRLQDHERAELLVDISDHPVEQLEGLGIVDAEQRYWHANAKELKQFIHVAKLHQPPKIDPPTNESTEPSNVSIMVVMANSSVDGSKRLEVRFKNLGPNVLQPRYARVEWSYEPPRKMPSEQGKPQVMESGASISLRHDGPLQVLLPTSETVFSLSLRDPLAQTIVAVLADDVPDKQLQVKVAASRWLWTASAEEVPIAIREFARAVLYEMR